MHMIKKEQVDLRDQVWFKIKKNLFINIFWIRQRKE